MNYWIAVDWGTTNFRAYLMDQTAVVIDKVESHQGLLSISDKEFATTLLNNISKWQAITDLATTSIYMAGMVGSKQGWREVDYLPMPFALSNIKHKLFKFLLPWNVNAFIVPGICGMNKFGWYDVMRGEETQLLGLRNIVKADNIVALLPGTHSKQAIMEKDKLISFSTIMTGELFSLLNRHSILTKNIAEEYDDQDGFLLGVKNGYDHPLSSVLFSARTLLLNHTLSSNQVRSYLSGLLIGNEFSLLGEHDEFYIVGSTGISEKYLVASRYLNKSAEIIDGEHCFLEGMAQIKK